MQKQTMKLKAINRIPLPPSKANTPNGRCSFSALEKGDVFLFGGNNSQGSPVEWFKCSERTARLIENNRVFYFKSGVVVTSTGRTIAA